MPDIQKYIADGVVKREKISMDIKYREICTEDLSAIVNNPDIKAAFFGQGFHDKVPKDQWTEKYLDKLSYAVVAECFNPEYLYYLDEVAEYVNGKKENGILKRIIRVIRAAAEYVKKHKWIFGALILVLVALIWAFAGRNK